MFPFKQVSLPNIPKLIYNSNHYRSDSEDIMLCQKLPPGTLSKGVVLVWLARGHLIYDNLYTTIQPASIPTSQYCTYQYDHRLKLLPH